MEGSSLWQDAWRRFRKNRAALYSVTILALITLFVIFAPLVVPFAYDFTDWLDGFLARRLGQTSAFGAFLDPVADKFLVCACVLVLVHLQRADIFIALIIVGREIAISALREWMAQIGASKSVAVHMAGKLKTAAQMAAIALLLYDGALWSLNARWWGTLLLWAAAVLTIWSMAYYLQRSVPEIRKRALQNGQYKNT